MNGTQKKKIIDLLFKLPALRRVGSWQCWRVTAVISPICSGIEINSQNTDKKVTFPRPEIVL